MTVEHESGEVLNNLKGNEGISSAKKVSDTLGFKAKKLSDKVLSKVKANPKMAAGAAVGAALGAYGLSKLKANKKGSQEKTASLIRLVNSGYDFDTAVTLVKEAGVFSGVIKALPGGMQVGTARGLLKARGYANDASKWISKNPLKATGGALAGGYALNSLTSNKN